MVMGFAVMTKWFCSLDSFRRTACAYWKFNVGVFIIIAINPDRYGAGADTAALEREKMLRVLLLGCH